MVAAGTVIVAEIIRQTVTRADRILMHVVTTRFLLLELQFMSQIRSEYQSAGSTR